jgi:hypothetical protein
MNNFHNHETGKSLLYCRRIAGSVLDLFSNNDTLYLRFENISKSKKKVGPVCPYKENPTSPFLVLKIFRNYETD